MANPNFVPVVARSWCYLHGAWEPIYENNFRVCIECGHSYWTARAVLYRHNEMMLDLWDRFHERGEPEPPRIDDVERILSCPVCNHDW